MAETIKYLEGRKLIESKKEGEYEFNQVHVIRVDNKKAYDEIMNICGEYDDYEEAYYKGIYYSWDDLDSIEVDKFLETIKECIERQIEEYDATEEDQCIIDSRELYNFLEGYEGYSFTFKENDVPLGEGVA